LDLLKQAKLIQADKKGQFIEYKLDKTGFEVIHAWFQSFSKYFEFPKPKIRIEI
jgi:hypothetical protein